MANLGSGSFISTMETEIISSRNIVDELLQEEFDASICTLTPPDSSTPRDDSSFVYGWDC